MSTIAIRIKKNIASSPPPYSWSNIDFYDYEIRSAPIMNGNSSIKKRLGNGKAKFVHRTGYGIIPITFKLYSSDILDSTSTLKKLQYLETLSALGTDIGEFIVYPLYASYPTFRFRCTFALGQIFDAIGMAGRYASLKELTVEFDIVERIEDVGIVAEEEIL